MSLWCARFNVGAAPVVSFFFESALGDALQWLVNRHSPC